MSRGDIGALKIEASTLANQNDRKVKGQCH